jgi:hypothetical protein
MDCLESLVSLRQLCTTDSTDALFFLDDAEGVNIDTVAQLASVMNGSGKKFAENIIESQARMMVADIESLVPKGYTIRASLNSFCNVCTLTGVTSSTIKTGVIVKNISPSKNTKLSIDSLKITIQDTGTFAIVFDDGVTPVSISHAFTAGTEVVLTNIRYKTDQKNVKLYVDGGAPVNALTCPVLKSCGCSGSTAQFNKDIQVKGLYNGSESSTQYGFIPCATIICSLDNIMCQLINQQPRLYGVALFYRATSRLYSEAAVTERNNLFASYSKEKKAELASFYMSLYYERLNGSNQVKGISDNLAAALNNLNDECVDCKRGTGVAWAVG